MPKGKCVFKKALMENDKYKLWLKPGKTIYHAKCSICGSEFSVDWGCESAVKSHERGSSHTKNIRDLESAKKGLAHLFFRKISTYSDAESSSAPATCENSAAASSSSTQSTAIDKFVAQQASVTRAEIIWVLRLVKNHDSFRSCLELGNDMKEMFPNNDIVSRFKLSKTKCAYFVTHGIAPWASCKLKYVTLHSSVFRLTSP